MKKAALILFAMVLMVSAVACNASLPVSTAVVDIGAPSVLPSESPSDSPSADTLAKPMQNGEDIQITVKEQSVAGDAESVDITITNVSDKQYTYGAVTSLEAEKNGTWEEVKPVADLMWIEIAYIIAPGQSNEDKVTLKPNYGTLQPGNYRIVKTFYTDDGSSLAAYGPFSVK